ncbi:MAG: RecQ family ATP-dependent DNA helicase [Alteromonas oceani]
MNNLSKQLEHQFGFSHFREGQQQAINQLLNGHSTLAVFPTGSGKSLCYQFTATMLPHLSLVISPLIALMHDQLAFLRKKGIPAACLDSSQNKEEAQQVIQQVREGELKILMISVERFKNERFRRFIETVPISMLVVDEAHCISEWGHNFRPDYLKLPHYQKQLKIPLVLLLTATAMRRVQKDMAQKFSIAYPHIVQTGFYRSNLDLDIMLPSGGNKQQSLLTALERTEGGGIVYVTQQKTADDIATFLTQRGYNARAYHAGLSSDLRSTIQTRFMNGETAIIVATIAFGMGIDKPDIRFVIHYDLPKSIENYSQEIGRAGRDGLPSRCILLAGLDGLNVLENFVLGDTPEPHAIQALLHNIATTTHNNQWETQTYGLSQATNIRALPLKTLLVQLELHGAIQAKHSYYADIKLKWQSSPEHICQALPNEQQALFHALVRCTQFKKVWGEPDFTQLNQQGFNRDTVMRLLNQLADANQLVVETKKLTDVYRVEPDKLTTELATQLQHYCETNEQSELARIATMLRFFSLNRCLNYNLALYFGDKNAPEHCGHCSVCRGQVLRLPKSEDSINPSLLTEDLRESQFWLSQQSPDFPVTAALLARFAAGLNQPIFTRLKARKHAQFGKHENVPYSTLLACAQNVLTNPSH